MNSRWFDVKCQSIECAVSAGFGDYGRENTIADWLKIEDGLSNGHILIMSVLTILIVFAYKPESSSFKIWYFCKVLYFQ